MVGNCKKNTNWTYIPCVARHDSISNYIKRLMAFKPVYIFYCIYCETHCATMSIIAFDNQMDSDSDDCNNISELSAPSDYLEEVVHDHVHGFCLL